MKYLIHIGFHKTGSTWLQKQLFSNDLENFNPIIPKSSSIIKGSKQVKYIGKFFFHFNEINEEYIFDDLALKKIINNDCVLDKEKYNVVSNEALVGKGTNSFTNGLELSRKIKRVFDSTKILIGIREQRSLAISMYAEYLKNGGMLNVKEYFDLSKKDYFPRSFNFGSYRYSHLIKQYFDLFGIENVYIYPIEQWENDFNLFLKGFYNFLGIDTSESNINYNTKENVKYGFGTLQIARLLSPIIYKCNGNSYSSIGLTRSSKKWFNILNFIENIYPISLNKKKNNFIKNEINNIISDLYFEDNVRTQELIKVNLSNYGYYK